MIQEEKPSDIIPFFLRAIRDIETRDR
jgi:hypothetical protein